MSKLFGKNSDRGLPFVSVVMPAYNEEKYIGATIETLLKQDYAGQFEIVVANNNSSDRTAEIAEGYGCRVLLEPQKGSRFAYQKGMSEAKGDPILVTNADTLLPSNWITRIVETYIEDPSLIGVATKIKFYGCPDYVNQGLELFTYKLNKLESFWGISMSSTREAFEKVGGINHGYNTNEDAIYCLLLKKYGKVKVLMDVVAEASGRRFAGNVFQIFWNWFFSIGINSVYIGLQYSLRGRVKGLIEDFKDVREEERLSNNYRQLRELSAKSQKTIHKHLKKAFNIVKNSLKTAYESVTG